MSKINRKKKITLEVLYEKIGGLVAKVDLDAKMDNLAAMTADEFSVLGERLDKVESRLENRIDGLNNSVKNYLELSDKRYLKLKQRDELIVRRGKIPISQKELNQLA